MQLKCTRLCPRSNKYANVFYIDQNCSCLAKSDIAFDYPLHLQRQYHRHHHHQHYHLQPHHHLEIKLERSFIFLASDAAGLCPHHLLQLGVIVFIFFRFCHRYNHQPSSALQFANIILNSVVVIIINVALGPVLTICWPASTSVLS